MRRNVMSEMKGEKMRNKVSREERMGRKRGEDGRI